MKTVAVLLALLVGANAAPVAPPSWQSDSTTTLVLSNGQTESSTCTSHTDDGLQAWRFDCQGHPSTVTLFNQGVQGMEMEVDSNNACVAWCPPTSTYFNQIQVGTGKNGTSAAKQTGPNQWTWSDLLIVIPPVGFLQSTLFHFRLIT